MTKDRVHSVYKRLETDEEFRARLRKLAGVEYIGSHVRGSDLDDWAWAGRKVQRRIVEDQSCLSGYHPTPPSVVPGCFTTGPMLIRLTPNEPVASMVDMSDNSKTVTTYQVTIWMAGDIATAHRIVRAFCYTEGACFTVTPSKFIYTGGEEDGFAIGLVNYPRFPSEPSDLQAKAETLALKLLPACNQRTCLLVGTAETKWLVVEPTGAA